MSALPHFSIADLVADATRLTVGKDDYLVVTIHEPRHVTQQQARGMLAHLSQMMPQLQGRIIVKPAEIEFEVKSKEEVAADADVPPWLR